MDQRTETNKRQVGGSHYDADYQHWDWAIDLRLGCLEYQISRYVLRCRKKNGLEDLDKAIHFCEKAIEAYEYKGYRNVVSIGRPGSNARTRIFELADKVCDQSKCKLTERKILHKISLWWTRGDMAEIREDIVHLKEEIANAV